MTQQISMRFVAPQVAYATWGLPGAACFVDARERERNPGARLIPGTRRADAVSLSAAHACASQAVIVYCEDGSHSRDCATALERLGVRAGVLEGGLAAWQAAGYPTLKARPELGVPGGSLWITRERPKIDRLACPWLIRRFVDPDAQFFYTAAHRVRAEAEALGAQPYDIADVTFSHRGANCSFDAFLDEFELHDPVLDTMATIVRGADTAELSLAPQAPGLLAISLGLAANIADDIVLLEQAMTLYDALYAWCKTARHETHSWPKQGNAPANERVSG